MSGIRKWLEENPDQLFDRLVDNELSAAEQRELLTVLEDEPGGWRRCALAFIEANVWRNALNGVPAAETALLADTEKTTPSAVGFVPRGRPQRPWAYVLALAASVLVAFVCGRYADHRPANRELAMGQGAVTGGAAVSPVAMDKPAAASQPPSDHGLETRPAAELPAVPDWQTIQLNIADAAAGESAAVEVPCLDASHGGSTRLEETWLAGQDSAVSAQLLQTLQETGYAVTTEMEWWPIEMADGRHVVLPVEQVEVRFVGSELF